MSYLLNYYTPRFPASQGTSGGPYPQFYPQPRPGLGFYRPNQAFFRGRYAGVSRTLGQTPFDFTSINLSDPSTLLMLAGAGFLLWNLFKGGRRVGRAVKRHRRSRARRQQRKREFELDLPYGGAAGR